MSDDLTAQTLTIISLAQAELTQGNIAAWPLRLRGVPVPTSGMVRASFDAFVRSEDRWSSASSNAVSSGRAWRCVAPRTASVTSSAPKKCVTTSACSRGDWRRDHRHLARTVEERVGALAFGCFAEYATFRALEVDPSPGAWARASFVRDIILSPLPAPMAIPLGIDAGLAAFVAVRNIVERLDFGGVVSGKIERLWERASERPELARIEELLGFHPLDLLRRLLTREQ